ncbi:MAG: penicillin-binding transpeptidase domain-containing protein [Acetobacteraceae bacterium]
MSDGPIRVGGYSPANDEAGFRGDVTLEDGLAQSLNTVSVRLLLQAGGPRAVAAVAHRLGIADALPDNASLALGTGEVGVLEMASAYATFFNGGYLVAPVAMEGLEADHRPVALPHPAATRVVDPELAGMMAQMMGAVVSRGTGRAAAVPGRVVAGKTGTTQDFRDAWFIGSVGPDIIAVWLGNDDNRPMRNVAGAAYRPGCFTTLPWKYDRRRPSNAGQAPDRPVGWAATPASRSSARHRRLQRQATITTHARGPREEGRLRRGPT